MNSITIKSRVYAIVIAHPSFRHEKIYIRTKMQKYLFLFFRLCHVLFSAAYRPPMNFRFRLEPSGKGRPSAAEERALARGTVRSDPPDRLIDARQIAK